MDNRVLRLLAGTLLSATVAFVFIAPSISAYIASQADDTAQGDTLLSHSPIHPLGKLTTPALATSEVLVVAFANIATVVLALIALRLLFILVLIEAIRAPPVRVAQQY